MGAARACNNRAYLSYSTNILLVYYDKTTEESTLKFHSTKKPNITKFRNHGIILQILSFNTFKT